MKIDAALPAQASGFALACPRDRAPLRAGPAGTLCCPACGAAYPVVNGVPVLLNDSASVFATADYLAGTGYAGPSYGGAADTARGPRLLWRRLARRLGQARTSLVHPGPADAIAHVAALRPQPRVLVIGAGEARLDAAARILFTDVAFGPDVAVIADAHDLPFPDASFDLVIAVAVLEHVADPQRCVAEIGRVLDAGGHVFADTPFLQPVHMGAYDFTRFTPIGHRRLFRHFDEIAAGISMGSGSALAWTLGGALLSVSAWRPWQLAARMLGLLVTPPLRWLDRWLAGSGDAAGGCWFFGRARGALGPVPDRVLVDNYRAGFGRGPRTLPPPGAA